MVKRKGKKDLVKFSDDVMVISLRDVPLNERRKEADKPLFLTRYD